MACCCSLLALELSDNLEATEELEVKTEEVAASAAEVAGSGAADSSGAAAGSAGVAGAAAGSSGSTAAAAADDKVAGGGVDAGEGEVVLLLFRVIEEAVDMMAQTGSFE